MRLWIIGTCAVLLIGLLGGITLASKRPVVRGIIVNHHLFAHNLIEAEFASVKSLNPSVVVLISPNHFDEGVGPAQTTVRVWKTSDGELFVHPVVQELVQSRHIVNRDGTFVHEHGISNVIPFIKKTFPDTRIVPLVIKERARDEAIDELARVIHAAVPMDALFVGSFDFSHELPSIVAAYHDRMSVAAIRNHDYEAVRQLDIDSRAGLRLLLRIMELRDAPTFELAANTNAGQLSGMPWSIDNTSYITGQFVTNRPHMRDETFTILVLPSADDAAFARMPRLLYGQHMTVRAGDRITQEQRDRVRQLGHALAGEVWPAHDSAALAITITRAGVRYEHLGLVRERALFRWPHKEEYDILQHTSSPEPSLFK